ncbi:MAG TPA: DUF808 family protein [Edaphocola sp.]|nr:DUF808 family protein [Edaphocola sp.]
MASGIFAVLDDISTLMDDVALASKIASQKTAGILGDDLAVNAEKATGFVSSRELPVLWAIAKGSLINKAIIIPVVILLQVFLPIAIKVILACGGIYLAFEGVEKIIDYFFHKKRQPHKASGSIIEKDGDTEKAKIKSAITTDFILSVEIVIIALGTVLDKSLSIQITTVAIVGVLATVGVYGFVALIVRMDDTGFKLIRRFGDKGLMGKAGKILVNALPVIIRFFAVVGTIALILVAGGIFAHNIPYLHHHILAGWPSFIREPIFGLAIGAIAVLLLALGKGIAGMFERK